MPLKRGFRPIRRTDDDEIYCQLGSYERRAQDLELWSSRALSSPRSALTGTSGGPKAVERAKKPASVVPSTPLTVV